MKPAGLRGESMRSKIRPVLLAAFFGAASVCSLPLEAGDWPQWRGPHFNGVSDAKNVPVEWSKDQNVAWRLQLPGRAGATPAIWGDRIFLTSTSGDDLLLMCVGTDGKEQWKKVVGRGNETARGDEGDTTSPSPATDGKHVWAFMGNGDLACYTVDGQEVWRTNLQERFGKFDIQFGMSTTPVLHDGRLFFQIIHGSMRAEVNEEPAYVVALDAATGDTVWQTPRQTGAVQENRHSYASAILYDFDGVTQLITHGSDYTIAYDLNGKELWRLGNYNPRNAPGFNPYYRFVASPGIGPGIVVCPTAKGGPVFAVRPDARGNVTLDAEPVLWSLDRGTPDVPTPLVHDGLVYLCGETGILQCVDAKTGESYYTERTNNKRHRASPVYADGHVYLTNRDGKVTVVKAGKTFEVVAENDTNEQQSATPVILDGTIYLRTFDALWAIRGK